MINDIRITEFDHTDYESYLEQLINAHHDKDGFAIVDTSEGTPAGNVTRSGSFVFLEPTAIFWGSNSSAFQATTDKFQKFPSVWESLAKLLSSLADISKANEIPCAAGHLSYELLHAIESVPRNKQSNTVVPDYLFYLYQTILFVPDSSKQSAKLYQLDWQKYPSPIWDIRIEDLIAPQGILNSSEESSNQEITNHSLPWEIEKYSDCPSTKYMAKVEKIRDLIVEGEVYQVNLSQQFSLPYSESPSKIYKQLRKDISSPQGGYLNVCSSRIKPYTVLSSSPELFLKRRKGRLFCSPIKGTISRGATLEQDLENRNTLLTSSKDRAELAMIVDLIRNDMGKIAKIGSVHVGNFGRLQSTSYVHHLVSDIYCSPKKTASTLDILKALFPCGSITGAPKIAAMKCIAELENSRRGVYTGSLGILFPGGDFALNVAIRTGVLQDQKLTFSSGGGITLNSSPESEYKESLAKASGLFRAWEKSVS